MQRPQIVLQAIQSLLPEAAILFEPVVHALERTVEDLVSIAPRKTGTAGGRRAAEYVADRLRRAGMDEVYLEKSYSYSWAATEARLGPLGSFVIDFALGEIWTRPGLSRRDRSLIVVTILATLNQLNQLRSHVQGGVHHGLTRTEIEEIVRRALGSRFGMEQAEVSITLEKYCSSSATEGLAAWPISGPNTCTASSA